MKVYVIISLCFLNFTLSTAQVPNYVPLKGLLGWWPLDGNAIDSSLNQNHGVVDGASPAKNRFGLDNKALAFDGINDEVTFNVEQLLNFSISIWHLPLDKGENYDPIFQLKKNCLPQGYDRNKGVEMTTIYEENKLKISMMYGLRECTNADVTMGGRINNATASFKDWSHYVLTRDDSTKLVSVYQNGIKIYQNKYSFELVTDGDEVLRLGKFFQHKTASIWASCYNDDLGFWNRALDSNEVTMLYFSRNCDSKFVIQPKDTMVSNNEIEFFCELNDSNAKYSWETNQGFGWNGLSNAGQYSGANTNRLKIENLNSNNNNQRFRCITTSYCGNDTTIEAKLIFKTPTQTYNLIPKTISISPNPTFNEIHINGLEKPVRFSIFNSNGILLQNDYTADKIDFSNFRSGFYIININGISFKIIKI